MDPTQPTDIQPESRGWWSRNWKWFVPTGCLTFVVIAALLGCAIFFVVTKAMKASEAYQTAFDTAKDDPRVVAALGKPITPGYFTSGSINVNGSSGDAELSIPISGPKGKGTIYLEATKSAGEWTYSKLEVELVESGERIDLNDKGDESE
jgi:hypothetical protein